MPACRYTSWAQSTPAWGLTASRPGNVDGSLRTAVATTHAGGRGAAFAAASSPITTAHAPSDDGQLSRKWIGSHSEGDFLTFSREMPGRWRCAYGFFRALRRSFTATCQPM